MNRRNSSRVRLILMATVCAAAVAVMLVPSTAPAAISLDSEEAAFCRTVNEYRAANDLAPLMVSEKLTNAAEWYSNDMAAKSYFNGDHTDSMGRTAHQRIQAFGYTYSTSWGENIAWGNSTATGTFNQWKNSPPHNANMLNASFKVLGIGRGSNSSTTYWTTDFGGFVDPGAIPCPGTAGPTPTPTATGTPTPTATPAGPALSVRDNSVVEGNSGTGATKVMRFTVTIPTASPTVVRVNYATGDGSAVAGSDYQATSGQLTIPAGFRTGIIPVNIVKDRADEPDETFELNLSIPVNAAIADGTATGTIKNDD